MTLWLGWILAWALGIAILCAVPERGAPLPGDLAFVIGSGFLAGQFLLTLWMRALSIAGVPFGIGAIAMPLAAATALCGWMAWRIGGASVLMRLPQELRALSGMNLGRSQRLFWFTLLAWLVLRFGLLLIEVLRRPLYPWDAWAQWATKARVWYALKSIGGFGTAAQWMSAPAGSIYYDPAPHYPATVPLTQVWSATLLGRWDDALVNLPWWITAVAFGIALYGWLRQNGFREVHALVGAWLAVSLPILDTHVALAGYADLAMATYLTMTALVALRYMRTRTLRDLLITILLGTACVVIKNSGKLWLAMLVPGLFAALLPHYGLRFATACFGVAAIAAPALTGVGMTVLGHHLHLDFDMPWNRLLQAYFAFANWHLLFYGVVAVLVLGWRQMLSHELAPLTLVVAAGFAFLMSGLAFTNARPWVGDQSTVNRATLHLAPLIVVWMLMTFRAWAAAWTSATQPSRTEMPSQSTSP